MVVLKFDNLVAIHADEMVVAWPLDKIRIVVFVIFPEIHFPQKSAFHEQRERAVNSGSGDSTVDFAGHLEKHFCREVLGGGEGRFNDRIPLGSLSQPLFFEENV